MFDFLRVSELESLKDDLRAANRSIKSLRAKNEQLKQCSLEKEIELDSKIKDAELIMRKANNSLGPRLVEIKTFDKTKASLYYKLAEVWNTDEVRWMLKDIESSALETTITDFEHSDRNFGMLFGIRMVIKKLSESIRIAKAIDQEVTQGE